MAPVLQGRRKRHKMLLQAVYVRDADEVILVVCQLTEGRAEPHAASEPATDVGQVDVGDSQGDRTKDLVHLGQVAFDVVGVANAPYLGHGDTPLRIPIRPLRHFVPPVRSIRVIVSMKLDSRGGCLIEGEGRA